MLASHYQDLAATQERHREAPDLIIQNYKKANSVSWSVEATAKLANICFHSGKFDQSIEHYQSAIKFKQQLSEPIP